MTSTNRTPSLFRASLPLLIGLALSAGAFAQAPNAPTTNSDSNSAMNSAPQSGSVSDATTADKADPAVNSVAPSDNAVMPADNSVANSADANSSASSADSSNSAMSTSAPTRPSSPATSMTETEPASEPSNIPWLPILGGVAALVVIALVFFALKGRRPGQIIASKDNVPK